MMNVTTPPPVIEVIEAQVTEVSGKHLVSFFLHSMDGYLVAKKCEQVVQGAVIIMCVIHSVFSPQRYSMQVLAWV